MFNRKKTKASVVLAIAFLAAMSSSAFAQAGPFGNSPSIGPVVQAFCPNPAGKLQCLNSCMLTYINCKTRFNGEPEADVQACQASYNNCAQTCNSRLIWTMPCDNAGRNGQSLQPQPEPLPW